VCRIKISIVYPRRLDTPALAARRPQNGAITGGPDGSAGPGFGAAAVAGPGPGGVRRPVEIRFPKPVASVTPVLWGSIGSEAVVEA
jgi:hypothetical protein